MYSIISNISDHFSFTLVCRLTRSMDIHHKVLNTAVRGKLYHGMPYPHTRKPVHFITCYSIALPAYIFYGNGILAEHRKEAIMLSWLCIAGNQQDNHTQKKACCGPVNVIETA